MFAHPFIKAALSLKIVVIKQQITLYGNIKTIKILGVSDAIFTWKMQGVRRQR